MKVLRLASLAAPFVLPVQRRRKASRQNISENGRAISHISLSPDGKRIAILAPIPGGSGTALLTGPIDGSGELKPVLTSSGKPDQLTYCKWSTSTRLVCGLYMIDGSVGSQLSFTRMIALDSWFERQGIEPADDFLRAGRGAIGGLGTRLASRGGG